MAQPIKLSDYKNEEQAPAQQTPLFSPPPGYVLDEPKGMMKEGKTEDVTNTAAPYLGRLAANSLPMFGGMFGSLPGAGLGSVGKIALQNEMPSIFGERPKDPVDFAKTLGVDLLSQGVLPQLLGKIASGFAAGNLKARALASNPLQQFPAVQQGVAKEMTQQIMSQYVKRPESEIIGAAAQKTPLRSTIDNPIGESLFQFKSELASGGPINQSFKDLTKKVFSDVSNVRNMQIAAGPDATAELAYHKVLTENFKESSGSIDAKAILDHLGGKNQEIYETAMGKGIDTFKDFLGELANQQKTKGVMDKVLSYSKGRLFLTGALMATSGHFFGPVGAAAGAVPVVTNEMLAKVMANPQTAKLVVQAMRTPASSSQSAALTEVLTGLFHQASALATVPER